jgi:putative membrane protein
MGRGVQPAVTDTGDERIDYRFSLANERTFLAWIRTAIALLAGGLLAAKAIEFEHDVWRWVVCLPPLLGGAAVALRSRGRRRANDEAMHAGRPLPTGPDADILSFALALYAVLVIVAVVFD